MEEKERTRSDLITIDVRLFGTEVLGFWISKRSQGLYLFKRCLFERNRWQKRCWCKVLAAPGWQKWSDEPLCLDHLAEWRRQMSEDIYLRGSRSIYAYLGDWREVAVA